VSTPLQLSGYCVDLLKVEANARFDKRREITVSVGVDPQALHHAKDPALHQIVLTVSFERAKGDPKGTPYTGKIVGRGFFRLEPSDLSDADKANLVLLNGSSILLGLLRAQVAQVTALGSNGVFLLPPVNLVEVFAAKAASLEAAATETT